MKRIVLSAFLVLGMTVPMASPAQAIFGLSTCEKVKKQMTALEVKILGLYDLQGTRWTYKNYGEESEVWSPNKVSEKAIRDFLRKDLINEVWKLGTNNPKCFTTTQNLQIKKYTNKHASDYFYLGEITKYSQVGICDKLLNKNPWQLSLNDNKQKAKCSIEVLPTASFKLEYKSIYNY